MTQRKCPQAKNNMCWDRGDCKDCQWNKLITKYERKIVRLQKKANQAPLDAISLMHYKLTETNKGKFTTEQLNLISAVFANIEDQVRNEQK